MIWNWRPWFAMGWFWRPVCWWLCVRDMLHQLIHVKRAMWVTPQGHRWRQYFDERDTRLLYVWVCDRCCRCIAVKRTPDQLRELRGRLDASAAAWKRHQEGASPCP